MSTAKPYVVGIAGGSCSGKTLLARGMAELLSDWAPQTLCLDVYYRDMGHGDPEEMANYNFDHPDALDVDLMTEQLTAFLAGEEIRVPVYDYATHSRAPREKWTPRLLRPASGRRPVVILEGLFTLHWKDVRDLLDVAIFVDASRSVCLSRRMERDTRERGDTRRIIIHQFQNFVCPMYEKFVQPSRRFADAVVDGNDPVEKSARAALRLVAPNLSVA